jgi:hypothetical protein
VNDEVKERKMSSSRDMRSSVKQRHEWHTTTHTNYSYENNNLCLTVCKRLTEMGKVAVCCICCNC